MVVDAAWEWNLQRKKQTQEADSDTWIQLQVWIHHMDLPGMSDKSIF